MLLYETITADIIESAQRIHREIGPGLFESVYKRVLADDLMRKGYQVEIEKACRERLAAIFFTQLLTYLRLLDMRVGLLINFGESSLVVRRIVN